MFKVIFLGSTGVGKTSIINRKKFNTFQIRVDPTVGTGRTSILVDCEDKKADLCIWDTAGQEKYASLVPLFVRDTIVAVVVASLSDYQSIENIDQWLDELKKNNEDPAIIVAINKIDLESPVSESVDQIAERLGPKYTNLFFVSAKTGAGIDDLFSRIAYLAFESRSPEISATVSIKEQPVSPVKDKKNCC